MKKLLQIVGIIAAVLALHAVVATDAQAKYVSSDSITVNVNMEMPHYKVRFMSNNGTGTMADQDFKYGETKSLSENEFEREDYVFTGWNRAADGSGAAYEDKEQVNNLSNVNNDVIVLYAQWEYMPMQTVFYHAGVCEFNGVVNGVPQEITGENCEYANKGLTYIDTGELLYSEGNYLKDFEIGFKIVEYNPSENDTQATFINSKYESGSTNSGNPGFVVRKSTDKIEITQMIRGNQKASASFQASSLTEIKVARVDEKIYYSINGGDYVQLQSNVGTHDYHDVPTWIGAAPTKEKDEHGKYIPYEDRYIKAKLSDIYIKVGNYDIYKHTATYHANGDDATVSPEQKVYLGDSSLGAMPVPVRPGHAFEGWYTEAEGGVKVRGDYRITSDMDLYAHWSEDTNICEVTVDGNTIRRETLSECVAAATSGQQATITVSADIYEDITVVADQDIEFDLGDNIWTDGGDNKKPVITNNGGIVRIKNGTITSPRNDAVINNNKVNGVAGQLYITGGRIVATGGKQAVYNDGGYVRISGDAYLSSVSSNKATVHNRNGGNMEILGGTIESAEFAGVRNESGSQMLTIGEQGGGIQTTPTIRGKTYGVLAEANFKFYDGILMGRTAAVSNPTKIIDQESETLTNGSTEINDVTYYTLYNE
jgi:uncharacterized repeat protein (TIGR02543 family)